MTTCPACHSNEHRVVFEYPEDYEYFSQRIVKGRIVECLSCESIYQDPWPSNKEIEGFYPEDYQNYKRKDVPLLSILLQFFIDSAARNFINRYGAGIKLLDFGCGDGSFLISLYHQGVRNVFGFEPHKRENSSVTDQGVIFIDEIGQIGKLGPFDVIRMNHVIEHLSDLDSTMSALAGLLKPNGKLILQTPNPKTVTRKIFGRFWGALHYPYHTVLFTPAGLGKGSYRWGLGIDSINGCTLPTGWAMSIENVIKNYIKSTRRGRLPFYGLLVLACLPFAIIEKIVLHQKAAVLDYVLIKRMNNR